MSFKNASLMSDHEKESDISRSPFTLRMRLTDASATCWEPSSDLTISCLIVVHLPILIRIVLYEPLVSRRVIPYSLYFD